MLNVNTGVENLNVPASAHAQRLDNFLRSHLKGVPKSRIYRIIRRGEVRLNSARCAPHTLLQSGQRLRIPPVRRSVPNAPLPLSQSLICLLEEMVLYEDAQVLIVNKPAKFAVHGGSGVRQGLIEALRIQRPNEDLMLVHRLDKDTSGCLVLAKGRMVLLELQRQWRARAVEKIYHLWVQGYWKSEWREITVPLMPQRQCSGERMTFPNTQGKSALTRFQVIRRAAAYSLLEARPISGRMHQIRVHCACRGCAIVGDQKYAFLARPSTGVVANDRVQAASSLLLHARTIIFQHPQTRKPLRCQAPYPSDFMIHPTYA